jgi:hypothetical protein
MRAIERRLSALEAIRGNPFAEMSDEELQGRLMHVCEQIEARGGPIRPDWREALEREDYRSLVNDLGIKSCDA